MPDERGGKAIDPDAAGAVVTIYDSRPSLAVQAASVVFGVKAAAAIGGGLWWGGRVAAEAYEASLSVAEAGASVAAAAEELSGAGATLWGPPALIVVGLATWQVMKRSVTKVVLKLERLVHEDGGGEDIRVTHMPVLPFLQPPSITVPRGDCEAAEADSLTPNFFTVPGGRWYLLPMPGWLSEDKDYLKVFLYWRYFRDTPPPPSDESLIQIEGFGSYRPMQFADAAHPVAQRIGWPATSEDLAQSPFHEVHGDVYADFQLGTKLTLAEQREAAAKARLHGRAAALAFLDDVERRRAEGAAAAEVRGIEAQSAPSGTGSAASGGEEAAVGEAAGSLESATAKGDTGTDQDRR
ncbi:hypothetical protein FNF29_04253 [Cafeteria roenbergensis]|uniref:Uncharacterized protein n=1 Tax=Cafeteria roenbergensis TaxID=33653 RepID=A0A5A8CGT2_CAFRO|nr:hypothetical protein FNF29_04253 [Cafeteria roenbergensis]|eukprot:KAA0151847.1 hypothetical protein FNF29_04253 [Cafeteria roenbergensis]